MKQPLMFVKCKECGEEHFQGEVRTVNIEEDEFTGADILTFVCPLTDRITTSQIYMLNQ
jgi:hypothetical protein